MSATKNFAFSCTAVCVAEAVTIPVDVVKTRLQVQGELGATRQYRGSFHAVKTIVGTEGISSLYRGLEPALLRQATYGTLRYGLYEPIQGIVRSVLSPSSSGAGGNSAFGVKVVSGALSGLISSSLCNPTDVVKTRMMLHQGGRRYSGGIIGAFREVWRAEGLRGLYRGVGPTAARASVGASSELATYDEVKLRLTTAFPSLRDSFKGHLASSLVAGFISAVLMCPFDVIRTRLQRDGSHYRGLVDCAVQSVRAEGPLCLWKGFWPQYARVGPRVVIIFVVLEQLKARF